MLLVPRSITRNTSPVLRLRCQRSDRLKQHGPVCSLCLPLTLCPIVLVSHGALEQSHSALIMSVSHSALMSLVLHSVLIMSQY